MLFFFGRGHLGIVDVLSRAGATSGGGEGFAIVGIMFLALASETESVMISTFSQWT